MSDKENLATTETPTSNVPKTSFVGVDPETSKQLEELFASMPEPEIQVQVETETTSEEQKVDDLQQVSKETESTPVTETVAKESDKLATYAEQITQLTTREKEYKKKEKELEEKLKQAEQFQQQFENWKKDPTKLLEGLTENGVTFDSLVSAQVDKIKGKDPKKEMEELVAAKVAETLKKKEEEQQLNQQTKQKEVEQKATTIIKDVVEKNKEKYKNLVDWPNYEQEVWAFLVGSNERGISLTFEEGCQKLEEHLVGKYKRIAQQNGWFKDEEKQDNSSSSNKGTSDVLPRDDAKIKTISSNLEKPAPVVKEKTQTGYKTWFDEIDEIAKMI